MFGSNFLTIRNKSIIPLAGINIPIAKHHHWSFKETITTKLISLNKLNGKSLEIEISKADFNKSIICDIELFMNKSQIQYSDFIKSKSNSPCWSFVTLYYLAFFCSTCFFRFLNKGFIFLNNEQKQKLEKFSLAMNSSPIALDSGNYFFSYKEENLNGNVVLNLSFKGESVHKMTWLQLENTLREFNTHADSEEKPIYSLLLSHFAAFKAEYPSNLRNKLNYNADSSILDLNNLIRRVDIKSISANFVKGLYKLGLDVTLENQINSVAYLSVFLIKFNNEIYKEYSSRISSPNSFANARASYLSTSKVEMI